MKEVVIFLRLLIRNPYSLLGTILMVFSIILNIDIFILKFSIFSFLLDWTDFMILQLNKMITGGSFLALLGTKFGFHSYSYYKRIEKVYRKRGATEVCKLHTSEPCAEVAMRMAKKDLGIM